MQWGARMPSDSRRAGYSRQDEDPGLKLPPLNPRASYSFTTTRNQPGGGEEDAAAGLGIGIMNAKCVIHTKPASAKPVRGPRGLSQSARFGRSSRRRHAPAAKQPAHHRSAGAATRRSSATETRKKRHTHTQSAQLGSSERVLKREGSGRSVSAPPSRGPATSSSSSSRPRRQSRGKREEDESSEADGSQASAITQPAVKQRYLYTVLHGNNSRLLKVCFRARRGWAPTPTKKSLELYNFIWEQYKKGARFKLQRASKGRKQLINHLEFNACLSTKKGMYKSLRRMYKAEGQPDALLDIVPATYYVTSRPATTGDDADEEESDGSDDEGTPDSGVEASEGYQAFKKHFLRLRAEAGEGDESEVEASSGKGREMTNIWIIKPAHLTNRGSGISVANTLPEVLKIVSKRRRGAAAAQWIVQKYIERPLLVHGRKFDLRCYVLLVACNKGNGLRGYLYRDGYIRTSCKKYSRGKLKDKFIHLTNDAVQKKSASYGKFEAGNKMSYREFAVYLEQHEDGQGLRMFDTILPEVAKHVAESLRSVAASINRKRSRSCFELYGYDFMVDANFKTWLVEVNSNPCLDLACPFLTFLVPRMLEDVFRLTVDHSFPPPGIDASAASQAASEATTPREVDAAEELARSLENVAAYGDSKGKGRSAQQLAVTQYPPTHPEQCPAGSPPAGFERVFAVKDVSTAVKVKVKGAGSAEE